MIKVTKLILSILLLIFLTWSSFILFRYMEADLYAFVGERKMADGDHKGAREFFAGALRLTHSEARYYSLYARSLYALARKNKSAHRAVQQLQEAKESYERAVELNPQEGNSWLDLAQVCWWMSGFEGYEEEGRKAESLFLKALETDPNNGKFLYAVAHYYLSSADPSASFPYLTRLATVHPDAFRSLKESPRWSDAAGKHFHEGLRAAANGDFITRGQALQALASMAEEEKNWSDALAYTQKRLDLGGSAADPGLLRNLGYYHLQLGRIPEAKEAFLHILSSSADRRQELHLLFEMLKKDDVLDFYVQICKETARFDALVGRNLSFILGRAYFLRNDPDTAARHFKRSVKEQETAEAHGYLAEIGLALKDWDTAEVESHRAVVLDPRNGRYHLLLARSLEAQHKYSAAARVIEQAFEQALNPGEEHLRYLADLYSYAGNYRAAIRVWKSAFEQAPRNADYPRRIAGAYQVLKDYPSARQYYQAVVDLLPNDQAARNELLAVQKYLRD